jgi:ketosteroid isomerase-like protein
MSKENVEIVRRVYEAARRRDSAAVFALYDAGVVLDNTRLQVPGVGADTVYHGHDGLRTFFRDWHEAWQSIDYDFDELIDAPGDKVVSLVTRRGRGRESGADVELALALAWTIRDGKVVRVVWFSSRDEALRAVGLPE